MKDKFAIYAPFWDPSGFAEVARNVVKEMIPIHPDFDLINHDNWSILEVHVEDSLGKEILNREVRAPKKLDKNEPILSIAIPDVYPIRKYRKNFGLSMFEVSNIPLKWVGILNILESVWVPSSFNYETYSNSGVNEDILEVMPLGVDFDRYNPNIDGKIPIANAPGYRFFYNFTYNYRKGPDVLLKAYLNEFTSEDDCTLILKTYSGIPNERATQYIKKKINKILDDYPKTNLPRIRWMNGLLPTNLMAYLYNSIDCMVSPTRGEGWHMSLAESMSMEKPTIVTGWSAHMDFTSNKYSYIIDYEMEKAKNQMEKIHYGYIDSEWANPSISHLQELMREVFENQEKAEAKGKKAREHLIKSGFSWKNSVHRMHKRLEELMQ